MRKMLLTALACASMVAAAAGTAEAQVYFRPWLRPRIVVMPRPWLPPVQVTPVQMMAPPPPMAYPPTYYYPPPPQYYVQPAPPQQIYIQPAPQPPVYLQQPPPPPPQVYYQQPQPQVYVQPQPPPQVYYQQPLPQPPVYAQPAPPPPPAYQPLPEPPLPPPPPPVAYRRPPLPQWQAKFGIGARVSGTLNSDELGGFSQMGIGGELLYRASRHLVLELGSEYQKRLDNGFARYDVPVTMGMRVHIGAPDWVVSPYFVFAGGAVYSNLDYLHAHDIAWFLDGQLGGGLEIRLGKHLALTADLRGDFRHRVTAPDQATANTLSVDGKPFEPIPNSYGIKGQLGLALYF
jgi:hypothetical protein